MEHSYTHLYTPITCTYSCFYTVTTVMNCCDRNHMAWKTENIYCLAL